MSTIAAQCHLAALLVDGGVELPRLWRHGAEGFLTWRFAGSSNDWTWGPADVAEAAADWRRLQREPPAEVAAFVAAHERFLDLCRRAGGGMPDGIEHDLDERQLTAIWHEERIAVVVEEIGGPSPDSASLV